MDARSPTTHVQSQRDSDPWTRSGQAHLAQHFLQPGCSASSHQKHLGQFTSYILRQSNTTTMPGSGKQSADVQQQIIEFLEAGIDPTTIHRRLKVGRSSIYRMKRSLQQHGTAYAPPETNKKNGRPKVLTAEQEQVGFRLVSCCLVVV